jgi:hypothetical protein
MVPKPNIRLDNFEEVSKRLNVSLVNLLRAGLRRELEIHCTSDTNLPVELRTFVVRIE